MMAEIYARGPIRFLTGFHLKERAEMRNTCSCSRSQVISWPASGPEHEQSFTRESRFSFVGEICRSKFKVCLGGVSLHTGDLADAEPVWVGELTQGGGVRMSIYTGKQKAVVAYVNTGIRRTGGGSRG